MAAFTDYKHQTEVGKALAWHYDKSLGIETACISVPLRGGLKSTARGRGRGRKTIGLGGAAANDGGCGTQVLCPPTRPRVKSPSCFFSLPMPVNSFWSCNAKAIYHAVGNDDDCSATIVLRTYLPKSVYRRFCPAGARGIVARLQRLHMRYFPVLGEADIREALERSRNRSRNRGARR